MKVNGTAKKLFAAMLSLSMVGAAAAIPVSAAAADEAASAQEVPAAAQEEVPSESEDGFVYGALPMTDEIDEDKIISNTEDYYQFVKENDSSGALGLPSAGSLPSAVDNSQSIYFPKIKSQGRIGSCVGWGNVYYMFTYTYNKAHGITTTEQNTFCPSLNYNLVSMAGNGGTWTDKMLDMLKYQGAATVDKCAIINPRSDYLLKETDYKTWIPQKNVWEDTLKHQIKDYVFYANSYKRTSSYSGYPLISSSTKITGAKDSDLDFIKMALSNGEVLSFCSDHSNWQTVKIKNKTQATNRPSYYNDINNAVVGEYAVTATKYTYGHCMTIVGYNDNIWIDINNNNVIDDAEMGAFKIANSWGDSRYDENNGFMWIAYDALNKVSAVNGAPELSTRNCIFYDVAGITVDTDATTSGVHLEYTLKTTNRNDNKLSVTAKDKNGVVVGTKYVAPYNDSLGDGAYSYYGDSQDLDGTMTFDLDNVVPGVSYKNFKDYTWTVTAYDGSASADLDVSSIKIVDSVNNKEYPMNSAAFTVNNSSKTVTIPTSGEVSENLVTIYYKGYSNPYIHYRAGTGAWTAVPGVRMTATNEMSGYTHKYTINIGSASYAEVCFNDGNNNWDSRNGANYIFNKGTWTYSNGTIKQVQNTELSASVSLSSKIVPSNQNFTIYGKATGGTAPYQYKYVYVRYGNEVVIKDYSTSTSVSTNLYSGAYTIKVYVKDSKGTVATATTEFTAAPVEIMSISANKTTVKAGETVQFTAGLSNNGVSVNCKFTATGNGTTQTISDSSSTTANWTPSKEGTYTIKVAAMYGNTELSSKTMSYTVEKGAVVTENLVTIYYKGYSTPYIHYRAGTGAWTAVPGVKMTATSEVSGYTHKHTINIGSASYAEVCFNDGNNNWDSRNGANYIFNKGTWTFSNGTIKQVQNTELSASLQLNDGACVPMFGETSATATATGGKAPYSYKFTYSGTNGESTLKDYSTASTASFILTDPATYTINAYVKDSTGKEVKTSKTLKVAYLTMTSVTASKTSFPAGETIRVKANLSDNVTGGVYTYKAYDANNKVTSLSTNSDNSASFSATTPGTYTIHAAFEFKNKTICSNTVKVTVTKASENVITIYYKGYSTPYIHYQVGSGAWTAVPGKAMTATSEKSGYTHKYTISLGTATYANVCFNDGRGNWDSRNGANYRFNKGTYTYYGGTIRSASSNAELPQEDIDTVLTNESTISKTVVKLGDAVKVTAVAKNGEGDYQYAVYYKKASSNKWSTAKKYSDVQTVKIRPSAATTYDVCVKVKDAAGNVAKKYFTVNVVKPLSVTASVADNDIAIGDNIKIDVKAEGGTGDYTYAYYYKAKNDTKWKTLAGYVSRDYKSFSVMKSGAYDICVKVKDSSGTVAKTYFVINVRELYSM